MFDYAALEDSGKPAADAVLSATTIVWGAFILPLMVASAVFVVRARTFPAAVLSSLVCAAEGVLLGILALAFLTAW